MKRIVQCPPIGTPINKSSPYAKQLNGLWLLNEGGGAKAYDSMGYGQNIGTLTNATYNQTGKGNACNFNGTSARIAVVQNSLVNSFTAITVSALVYFSSVTGNRIIVRKSTTANASIYQLDINLSKPRFVVNAASAGLVVAGGNTTLVVNQWYYLMGTWDGATAKAYINGVQETTTAALTGTPMNTSTTFSLFFGSTEVPDAFFSGNLQCIGLWSRAQNATGARQLSINPYIMFN